jgi:septal ring factor EnvC (AmiA/AmiB activator)
VKTLRHSKKALGQLAKTLRHLKKTLDPIEKALCQKTKQLCKDSKTLFPIAKRLCRMNGRNSSNNPRRTQTQRRLFNPTTTRTY